MNGSKRERHPPHSSQNRTHVLIWCSVACHTAAAPGTEKMITSRYRPGASRTIRLGSCDATMLRMELPATEMPTCCGCPTLNGTSICGRGPSGVIHTTLAPKSSAGSGPPPSQTSHRPLGTPCGHLGHLIPVSASFLGRITGLSSAGCPYGLGGSFTSGPCPPGGTVARFAGTLPPGECDLGGGELPHGTGGRLVTGPCPPSGPGGGELPHGTGGRLGTGPCSPSGLHPAVSIGIGSSGALPGVGGGDGNGADRSAPYGCSGCLS